MLCLYCGINPIKRNSQKFCSNACAHKGRNKTKHLPISAEKRAYKDETPPGYAGEVNHSDGTPAKYEDETRIPAADSMPLHRNRIGAGGWA